MIAAAAAGGFVLAAVAAALIVRWLRATHELTARACHEIRGPLTAAELALYAMRRHEEAPADRLAALEQQLHRARLAVEDLAAAPRGRRASDRVEPLAAAGLVANVGLTWAPVCAARGRGLVVRAAPPGATLHADPTRLAQAVGNLVANALEHGRGQVEIRPRTLGDRIRLEVHDRGPGLRRPLPELLRAPRAGRGWRGRGLAIAAEIAERHGGRLLTAPAADGTVVALELPLAAVGSRGQKAAR